jgi:hypothetical protein
LTPLLQDRRIAIALESGQQKSIRTGARLASIVERAGSAVVRARKPASWGSAAGRPRGMQLFDFAAFGNRP